MNLFFLPPALKLLLEQEEDVTRVQDGLYIDRADWKECSSELETIIERNNPSFLAREMIRALGSGRRPVHPRDITLSAAAAAASAMPREKRRFDAVVRRVQGCVFPELQSLLTKRMACPQMSVSTQTDGSPSGRGDKTVALTTVSRSLTKPLSFLMDTNLFFHCPPPNVYIFGQISGDGWITFPCTSGTRKQYHQHVQHREVSAQWTIRIEIDSF